jgi:leader peptidase (prepilin peptidase)/N-methyltransferase
MAACVIAITLRVHAVLVASAAGWLVVCGVPLAVIDVKIRRLPDLLTGACLAGIVVALTAAAAHAGAWHVLGRAAIGAVVVALCFALLAVARPGAAGLGDAKLSLSTGALAAWFGWGALVGSLLAAFLLAAAWGICLIAARRASLRRTQLAFGPFLLAGCLLAVLVAATAAWH